MKAGALARMILCTLLFMLLLATAQANSRPLDSVFVATSAPMWSGFQPSGWVTGTQVACMVEVDNQDGLITAGSSYRISTNGGASWSGELSQGLTVVLDGSGTHATLTVTNLALPESMTTDQNQIQFSIWDSLGLKWWSGAYVVRIDNTAPGSSVDTTGCFKSSWPGAITGNANDAGSGVRLVEITVRRSSDGRYYNGSSWQPALVWLSAAGTTDWSYPITPGEDTYVVQSRATDAVGHQQTAYGQGTFSHDVTAPQSVVVTTGCFKDDTWPDVIVGTANDVVSGVKNVEITLRRASDGRYYNGSSWSTTATWLLVAGTTAWSLPFTPPLETSYTVRSRATDNCGNVQSALGEATFTYDLTPPQSTVAISGCFKAADWPGVISGTASDALSGVASVQITLRRASDGFYYNGTSWSATATWLSVSGTSAWSLPFAPPIETSYAVRSRATDNCGHMQSVFGEATFVYDFTPPQSTVTTSGYFNGARWPGAISGSASDTSSGVASVQITLRRSSDGLYYNGTSWIVTATWLSVSATTTWSLPFLPSVETSYAVNSQAMDNCGNMQSAYGTATFTYDATAPGVPSTLLVVPFGWSRTNSFFVNWDNPSDLSGIARAHYKWNVAPSSSNDESPGSPVAGEGIQSISGLSVPAEGTHRLYLWLEDAAGNADFLNHGVTSAEAFRWDATPPTTSIESISGTLGCANWYTSTVQVDLSVVDATSGISVTFWRQDVGNWQQTSGFSFTVTGEGPHTIQYYSVDRAGNSEVPKSLSPQVKIDSVPPRSNPPRYTGTLGNNGWYISSVAAALSAVDATSGVSAIYHQLDNAAFEPGEAFEVTTDGVHTIHYYAVDAACNREAVQAASIPLKIDKTPPTTWAQTDGPSQDGCFTASPVTITLLTSDMASGAETSGVDNVRYRIGSGSWQQRSDALVTFTVSLPPGQREWVHTIQYYATDLAGNVETLRTLSIAIDQQAPGPIPYVPIVTPPSWTKTNCFTVTWDANPSDLCGIAGVYYSFSEPISATDGTLLRGDNVTSIPCLQVPVERGDGAHNVYLWLRDKAGNSDQRTRREFTLRLDRAPPEVTPVVAGNLCDAAGWYNSCVTVTFVATDVHSGMASGVISYQVNGGSWIEGGSYVTCRDGVSRISCRAMDSAGNVSDIVAAPLLKLDQTAPGAPMDIQVNPVSWAKENTFTLNWINPGDSSGLAGVFYKQGTLPISPTDGIYVDGVRSSLPIIASKEGELPVYVWLKDKACNSDHQKRAVAVLKYDSTPPTTTFSLSGTLGGNGWYTSAVEITLNGTDLASGWQSSRYRIGTGPWQSGSRFPIDADGVITFSYYSTDTAGNAEDVRIGSVRIDREPPSSYAYAESYSPTSSFTVRWNGNDALSGIATFDVQYRAGTAGAWQDWVLGVDSSQRSKLFTGAVPGKTYYFRSRATDKAGNTEPYPNAADMYVSVDPLQNGDFERPLGSEWEGRWISGEGGQTSQCLPTRTVVQSPAGGSTHAVVLGCPDQANEVPFGTSMICQSINVPSVQDMPAPMLYFRYRIFTYDVLWSQRYQRFYDSFNAGVVSAGSIEPTYVFTEGNKTQNYGILMDLQWRQGALDLRPHAGRTIRVCFANVTRVDMLFNTWTFLDDIRLVNVEHRLYVPVVLRQAPVAGMSVQARTEAVHSSSRVER